MRSNHVTAWLDDDPSRSQRFGSSIRTAHAITYPAHLTHACEFDRSETSQIRDPRTSPLLWRRACTNGATCVEIAELPDGGAAVRDGKDPEGPVLRFGGEEWAVFLAAVKAGRFDARPSPPAVGNG